MRAAILALLLFFPAALAPAAPASAEPLSRSDFVLWTQCTVTLYDHTDPGILDAVFQRLQELHRRLSVNIPGSELDAVSDAAGRAPVRVSDDVLLVVRKGLYYSEISHGLFDLTVGPLMKAWKMNSEDGSIPAPADLAKARALVNWRDIVVDEKEHRIYLRRPGMRLDVGALLKGYAADEVVRILAEKGVRSAIIDLGGNIRGRDHGHRGSPDLRDRRRAQNVHPFRHLLPVRGSMISLLEQAPGFCQDRTMRREDFVFCIGFEGSTAIVDGRLLRRYRSASTRRLAEAGLYKQAVCSAVFAGSGADLGEVLTIYNGRTTTPIRTVEDLKRTFGVSGVPEGVKKVTVV